MTATTRPSVHWTARMIAPVDELSGAPLLRREFALDTGHGDVVSAQLHVSSLGIFETSIGGRPVSDDVLSPGWSSYEWRLRYRTYNVAHLLAPTSVIGIALGNGWYRGRLGWQGRRAVYGDRLGAIAQLEIHFAEGRRADRVRHRPPRSLHRSARRPPGSTAADRDLDRAVRCDARRLRTEPRRLAAASVASPGSTSARARM